MVAPYSGAMFARVARSGRLRRATPGPKNSTNLPTTPFWRSAWVTVSTRSVAVAPSGSSPTSSRPMTSGGSRVIGSPSMAASASMPPTPQPITPRPLIMVVCESVPTRVSGKASQPPSGSRRLTTTVARYSRLTWWTMPVAGGTTRKLSKASCAQRKNSYRSRLRSNSRRAL